MSTAAADWTGGECRRLLAGLEGTPCSRGLFLVVDSWFGEPVLLPGTFVKMYLHTAAGQLQCRYDTPMEDYEGLTDEGAISHAQTATQMLTGK